MFAAADRSRAGGRPVGSHDAGRAATLRDVSDELFLSGATERRLTPKSILMIERKALQKIGRAIGPISSGTPT